TLRLLIPDDRRLTLIFSLLLLTSPQYLFWGRTFLIETCAVFYCLAFLYAAMRFYRRPGPVSFILMLSASLAGILAKSTTWPVYVVAFALFWATEAIKARRVNFGASGGVVMACVASLIAALLWIAFSDDLKMQSLLGGHLTSP